MMEHHAQVRPEVKPFHVSLAQGGGQGNMAFGFDGTAGSVCECPHGASAFGGIELEDHVLTD